MVYTYVNHVGCQIVELFFYNFLFLLCNKKQLQYSNQCHLLANLAIKKFHLSFTYVYSASDNDGDVYNNYTVLSVAIAAFTLSFATKKKTEVNYLLLLYTYLTVTFCVVSIVVDRSK